MSDIIKEDHGKYQIRPEEREPATPATYTVEGLIDVLQSEAEDRHYGKCLCCRPHGHIFGYGINVPGTSPGINGQQPKQANDWIHEQIHPHRFQDGARVRLTLEVLPDER